MMRQLLAKGIILVWIGIGLLPFSMFLEEQMWTSVGGERTGKVFVAPGSAAAKRGYALPGEGGAAKLVGAQADRFVKVKIDAGVAFSVGLVMIGLALRSGTDMGVGIGQSKWTALGRIIGVVSGRSSPAASRAFC